MDLQPDILCHLHSATVSMRKATGYKFGLLMNSIGFLLACLVMVAKESIFITGIAIIYSILGSCLLTYVIWMVSTMRNTFDGPTSYNFIAEILHRIEAIHVFDLKELVATWFVSVLRKPWKGYTRVTVTAASLLGPYLGIGMLLSCYIGTVNSSPALIDVFKIFLRIMSLIVSLEIGYHCFNLHNSINTVAKLIATLEGESITRLPLKGSPTKDGPGNVASEIPLRPDYQNETNCS
eukprot:Selendium_serpulae@DN6027_c0_g1_i3.p1